MPIYKQTTEITKIDDVWANIDRDIVEVYFGDKNIFTVWSEYTGTLPITITANGDALIDYRIYGADGGVGEPTESGEPAGYKLPMVISDQNLLPDNISQFNNGYVNTYGSINPPDATKKEKYSDYVSIVPNTDYTFAMANGFPGNPSGNIDAKLWRTIAFYKQDKTFISREPGSTDYALKPSPVTVTSPSDAFFVRVTWRSFGSEECPYLLPKRDIYPVYIGENQLDAGEYVSYGEQKIYRDVGGTLTPTDPPVPLPEIPTIDGTTIIDYDGTPKPSQMYVKYRKQYS